jgi:uncharacterized membrane protein
MLKTLSLLLMAVLYFLAGINHFIHPGSYIKIMPPWLPFHKELVWVSGALEIGLALLLLPTFSRKMAAWGIILLLVAVFPANVQMSVNYYKEHSPQWWITLLRLPLQLLLIWWAYTFTKPLVPSKAAFQDKPRPR